jgi:hypothetical protein
MAEAAAPTPITEWPEWSADPDGGNPVTQDLNALYDKVRQRRGKEIEWTIWRAQRVTIPCTG